MRINLQWGIDAIGYSRNLHSWRHMGHFWCICCDVSHFMMQWIWKQCVQRPQTNGQSSPGILQSVQQPSNAFLHIPQLSSFANHFHVATDVQLLIFTFMFKIQKKMRIQRRVMSRWKNRETNYSDCGQLPLTIGRRMRRAQLWSTQWQRVLTSIQKKRALRKTVLAHSRKF